MAPTSSSKAKKVHFESNDPPSFPEDFDPKAFAKLKVANLQSRLKKSEIAYGTRDTKPELQALVLLSVMEIVGLKKKVDEKLLEKVSGWCRGLVGDLHDEIEGRGLEKGANRWLCIEVLVQDEIATPKEEKPKKKKAKAASTANGKRKAKEVESDDEPSEESTKKTKRNGKGKVAAAVDEENDVAETSNDANTNTDATSTHPSPEVMNLLISTIFVDLAKGNATLEDSLPGCSHDTKDKVVELLNDTAAFASQAQLSKVLDEPTSEADKLVAWIASTYGRDIILAEGDLKIPGFSGAVKQFVIAKPRLNLEKSWKTLFTKARKTSMLLFHGTSYVHLQSILRTGFYPSQDKSRGTGVFLGVEPSTSYDYATSESRGYSVDRAGRSAADEPVKYGGRWKYDPYQNRPLLFGCEATGQGREQPGGAFHVVTGLKSVIARYIFLLGPPAAVGYPYYPRAGDIAPLRATVEPAMVAAFGKIRAGLDEEE
ncbi:hypothetical protein BDZ45DRAFT_417725 [Acephala macrosclerotiorum]|nr:hypothetical protein BDZ45DRAFT_417725 [Acephala macrosclerotiorum]